MTKTADTQYPVHELIRSRWSPRAYTHEPVSETELLTILEAGTWAPSSMNDQPWRFSWALKDNEALFQLHMNALLEGNKVWAQHASAIVLIAARSTFKANNVKNPSAKHDVGMATQNMLLQARDLDVFCHVIAGYDREYVIEKFALNAPFEPVTFVVFGKLGPAESLDEPYLSREKQPRERMSIPAVSFGPESPLQE